MKLLELFDTHLPTLNAKQLVEAAKVGREYQHLEDLLITDGAKGGIEAVNELKHIAQQPDTMNMKWDGGAAVYWGRNAKGEFVFAPKNQWDKGQMLDRTGLETEVQHTGRPRPGQSPEEFAEIRKGMAQRYMQLWDIFEKATPKDFRGYLNGDLMFTEQQQPGENGYYEFTPNKVTYRVAPNGLYGKMKTAKAFVAVHGKLQEFGAEATGNIEQVPEAEVLRFNKTPELIVLPTQHPAVKLSPIDQEAETTLGLISNNAKAIDDIANYTADRFTGFKKILYDYAVKRAKANGNLDFNAWLKDCKLSEPQKVTTQKVITEKAREWKIFWTAFDAVLKLKHDVLEDLHNIHGKHMANSLGITAITNNKPGGEGFVKTMKSGGMAKLVNPNFRSAPDNPRFNPNISENTFNSWTPFELTKGLSAVDRAYIDPIAEVLERKQGMEIVTQKLAELGIYVYHRDITLPDISEKLEKYKTIILKDMFEDIKENGIGYEVIRAVQALRAMGVKWPELAAIEKSINAKGAIREGFVNGMLAHLGGYQDEHNKFKSVKPDAAMDGKDLIRLVYEFAKASLSVKLYRNIRKLLENNKKAIIKYLLVKLHDQFNAPDPDDYLETDNFYWFTERFNDFKDIGINWPELATIEKSLTAKKNVKEGIVQSVGKALKKNAPQQIVHKLLARVEGAKTGGELLNALGYIRVYEVNPKQVIPIVVPIVEKAKPLIIKDILEELQSAGTDMHGHSYYVSEWAKARIADLRRIGIDWPELRVIEKSVLHDLKTTTIREELVGDEIQDDIYDNVQSIVDSLQDNDYSEDRYSLLWDCLTHLGDYYEDMPKVKFPNIAILLGEHKSEILKKILTTTMNHGAEGNLVKHRILALRKLGAKWPEFDTIERSIAHDAQKTLDEAPREKITCMACDGSGVDYGETCVTCGGKGETWDDCSYIDDDNSDSDYHNYIWNNDNEVSEEAESKANTPKEVVWAFGRMNPPHWGHHGLMMTLEKEAKKRGADWKLFVSSKQEPEKNPLSYERKVAWLLKLYPELQGHLVIDPNVKTPLVAATWLYAHGYRGSVFVAGEDDMPAYSAMINGGNNHGKTHPELLEQGKAFYFDPSEFVISPRLTSATSVRQTVANNDPEAFAKAVLGPRYATVDPKTIHDIETSMFNEIKQGMVQSPKPVKKGK